MPSRDARVDAYIAKQKDFAKPILEHLRAVVHEAVPECEETLKWSIPAFMHHGILAGMAAFKEYAAFNLWKASLVLGKDGVNLEAAGTFGKIYTIEDLPPRRELIGYLRAAAKLNEQGIKAPPKRSAPKKPIPMPADFRKALGGSRKAQKSWDGFPPSHKREYLEWITEAKREETRAKRIDQAVDWIAEGKQRNWKYQ